MVVNTNLEAFLNGGLLEVRVFNEEELKTKRNPQDIVNYAFSRIGDKGYNIISNNCEHFVNECLFGVIDIAMSGITITTERLGVINFSNPYYTESIVVVCKADDTSLDSAGTVVDILSVICGGEEE